MRFRYVLWPNALPYYAAAHEVAFTSSIVAAGLAEFFFSRRGLGFMLTQAMNKRFQGVLSLTLLCSFCASGLAQVITPPEPAPRHPL
jgi:ABC-type nitrate/sulfonate/bicarbonate transport system permease component